MPLQAPSLPHLAHGKSVDRIISIMGATGTGKSELINLLCGSQLAVGHGLKSCTRAIETAVMELDGERVILIDTPGFNDLTLSDTEVLKRIGDFLQATYENGVRLNGIIYLHKITDNRIGGIGYKNLEMFEKLCGEGAMSNVMLCTNMWGSVNPDDGQRFEDELLAEFWKPMIDKGAHTRRHDRTLESAHSIVRELVKLGTVKLRLQEELVDEKKTLLETAAGAEINKELLAQQAKHKKKLEEMEKDKEIALLLKDGEKQKAIHAECSILEAKYQKVLEDQEQLAKTREQEMIDLRQRIQEYENNSSSGFPGFLGHLVGSILGAIIGRRTDIL